MNIKWSEPVAGSTGTFTGDVSIADKIVHTGDTNTAIRFSGADTVSIETAGSERVRVDSSGNLQVVRNVSIDNNGELAVFEDDTSLGYTNSAKLSLDYASNVARIRSSGNGSFTSRPLAFFITNDEALRIDTSGRVLIGTTDVGGGNADDLTVATSGNTGITIRSGTSNTGNIFWSDATSGSDQYIGALEYHHSDNQFKFNISNTTRMTVDSTGDVTISDGDLVIGTSGHGIDFSATGDGSGASSVSELLDDYEEGFFTPTWSQGVSSPSYTNQHGGYVKVGRMVNFQINLSINGGTATGDHLKIAGLPFTSGSAGSVGYGGAVINYTGATFNVDGGVTLHVGQNDDDVKFYNNNGTALAGNNNDVNDITSHLIIHGQYISSS